jgi:hypothetical protein
MGASLQHGLLGTCAGRVAEDVALAPPPGDEPAEPAP